jgi:hypothetical protein
MITTSTKNKYSTNHINALYISVSYWDTYKQKSEDTTEDDIFQLQPYLDIMSTHENRHFLNYINFCYINVAMQSNFLFVN